MQLVLNLQATHETEFLDRRISVASNFKGSGAQGTQTLRRVQGAQELKAAKQIQVQCAS